MSTTDNPDEARSIRTKSKGGPRSAEVAKLISLLSDEETDEWTDPEQQNGRIVHLNELHRSLATVHTPSPGDIVCWKDGLKNRKRPAYGEPAIVIEVLKEPVFEGTDDAGSPYFREPLTLVLGLLNGDDFLIFHYDGRRFEPMATKG
jgi:hypothetical protein